MNTSTYHVYKDDTFPRKPVTIGIIPCSFDQSETSFKAIAGYVASKMSAFVNSSLVMKPKSKASYCKHENSAQKMEIPQNLVNLPWVLYRHMCVHEFYEEVCKLYY